MLIFLAFIMRAMGDIDWMKSFETEAEADEFAKEHSELSPLDPEMDDPDHYEKYDPPVVLIFEIDHPEGFQNGKYKRPVAIWHRGEKFSCAAAEK